MDQVNRQASRFLELAERGQSLYKQAHWGQSGTRANELGEMANASQGVVLLGPMADVTYLTRKGSEERAALYTHTFQPQSSPNAWPLLCFAANGSGLVIVRGGSRYRITPRGIEG